MDAETLRNIVREEVQPVRDDVRTLRRELGSVRAEVGSVREEVGSVRAEVGSVREEVGSVREEVGSVREEVGSVRAEVGSVREEVGSVREEVGSVREEVLAEVKASEARLAEGGRLRFRQMGNLYRGVLERLDAFEKLVSDQIGQTRGAIEALHQSIQGQDYRTDQLSRRVTELELEKAKPPE